MKRTALQLLTVVLFGVIQGTALLAPDAWAALVALFKTEI